MSQSIRSSSTPELEKYELLEEIGHGGMATVYRARDLQLEREVAVKVIHKHLRQNPEVRRRFISEAKAVAKLRHNNIVDVYDVSRDEDEERYLVVELIRGTTLRRAIEDAGRLPAEVAAAIALELCDALQHAHDKGIIHRDVKPENVLIELPGNASADSVRSSSQPQWFERLGRPGGDSKDTLPSDEKSSGRSSRPRVAIKLTDFGIAKVLDAQGVTSTGQILGSPAHMAPEQIEGDEIVPATDVFGLGVLLYECMVGHLPFEGKNPAQVLRRVLAGTFSAADSECPEVGGRWARIVAGALSHDVTERTATPRALGQAIADELAAVGVVNPRALLSAYFCDREGTSQELAKLLGARLLFRGEREHRKGNVQEAAADLNRALAFRPDDVAIMRRIGALTRARQWKRQGRRLAWLLALSLALGLGAFGLTRSLRQRDDAAVPPALSGRLPLELPRLPVASRRKSAVRPKPAPSLGVQPPVAAVEAASATTPRLRPSALRTIRSAASVRVGSSTVPTSLASRRVRFHLNPGGALTVDGQVLGSWMGRVLTLSVGSHSVRASQPDGVSCCNAYSGSRTVTAPTADKPDAVQVLTINLPLRDAIVSFGGGPPGAAVSCSNGLVLSRGATTQWKMKRVESNVTCTFAPGGAKAGFKLSAGQRAPIRWRP